VDFVAEDAGVGFGQGGAGWLGVGDGIRDWGAAGALRGQVHGGESTPRKVRADRLWGGGLIPGRNAGGAAA